jgi:hypothetical protein
MLRSTRTADVPPDHVAEAAGRCIVVHARDASRASALAALGFTRDGTGAWVREVAGDDAERARLLDALRGSGLPMARGREWSPAEVVERLRDAGLLSGPFREIAWRGPGRWACRDA